MLSSLFRGKKYRYRTAADVEGMDMEAILELPLSEVSPALRDDPGVSRVADAGRRRAMLNVAARAKLWSELPSADAKKRYLERDNETAIRNFLIREGAPSAAMNELSAKMRLQDYDAKASRAPLHPEVEAHRTKVLNERLTNLYRGGRVYTRGALRRRRARRAAARRRSVRRRSVRRGGVHRARGMTRGRARAPRRSRARRVRVAA